MGGILTLAIKDLRLIWRDLFTLFWIVGFPVIYAIFFGSVLGGGGDPGRGSLEIAITDFDNTELSQRFTASLASNEALAVEVMSEDEGREAVRRGWRAAHVTIPAGFGDSIGFTGEGQRAVDVAIDPSRRAEAAYVEGMIMAATFDLIREEMFSPARMRENLPEWRAEVAEQENLSVIERTALNSLFGSLETLMESVEVLESEQGQQTDPFQGPNVTDVAVERDSDQPRSAYEYMFPVAMLWAMIGCTAGFAISLVKERSAGTLLRLQVSPLSRTHILAGKAVACGLANVAVMIMLMVLGRMGFGIRIENPLGLGLALVSTALCFVGIMMLLSTLGRSVDAVGQSAWAVLLVLAMFGGAMVPRFIMPSWMQSLSDLSPIRWGIGVLEGASWRALTIPELLPGCVILLAMGAGCFVAGVLVMKRRGM
jgi:ABC-2 type transport system permease protein